jgi:hypothetical protein
MAFNTYIGDVIAIFKIGEKLWDLGWSERSKVGAYRPHLAALAAQTLCATNTLAACLVCRAKTVEFGLLIFYLSRTGIQCFLRFCKGLR